MKRVYRPYWEWEDYQHGMYNTPADKQTEIDNAVALLSYPDEFLQIASKLIREWPVAAAVNLTNPSNNKRAWIGQASCCLLHGVPELSTRQAWKRLTSEERQEANHVADKVIREYTKKNQRIHQNVEKERV